MKPSLSTTSATRTPGTKDRALIFPYFGISNTNCASICPYSEWHFHAQECGIFHLVAFFHRILRSASSSILLRVGGSIRTLVSTPLISNRHFPYLPPLPYLGFPAPVPLHTGCFFPPMVRAWARKPYFPFPGPRPIPGPGFVQTSTSIIEKLNSSMQLAARTRRRFCKALNRDVGFDAGCFGLESSPCRFPDLEVRLKTGVFFKTSTNIIDKLKSSMQRGPVAEFERFPPLIAFMES